MAPERFSESHGFLSATLETINALNSKSLKYLTKSDKETVCLGQRLGESLMPGDLVALSGHLGSGKTWLTKGIALGLGVDPDMVITSPSFALVNEYDGRHTLYHMDLYRLSELSEFLNAGLEEYIYCGGVVVMEWADRWPEIIHEQNVLINIEITGDQQREITFSGDSCRAMEIIRSMKQKVFEE